MSSAKKISYSEFGHNFIQQVVTARRIGSEIEAALLGADGEPRGGIGIELVDASGAVVLRGQSEFDGYVFFDSVPYGSYRLRLTEKAAQILGAKPEISGLLRVDRSQPSLRLGHLRIELLPLGRDLARAY